MDKLVSCEFNMDTACTELKFANSSMVVIDPIGYANRIVR